MPEHSHWQWVRNFDTTKPKTKPKQSIRNLYSAQPNRTPLRSPLRPPWFLNLAPYIQIQYIIHSADSIQDDLCLDFLYSIHNIYIYSYRFFLSCNKIQACRLICKRKRMWKTTWRSWASSIDLGATRKNVPKVTTLAIPKNRLSGLHKLTILTANNWYICL